MKKAVKKSIKKKQVSVADHPYKIGQAYLIRTVTMYQVGILVAVFPQEIVLKDAAWVADTGRFEKCLREGKLDEIEPIEKGNMIVGRGAIVDVAEWHHEIPREAI